MWSAYTKQRNRVTKEVRGSIRDHYEGLIEKIKEIQRICEKRSTESWIKILNPQQPLVFKYLDGKML